MEILTAKTIVGHRFTKTFTALTIVRHRYVKILTAKTIVEHRYTKIFTATTIAGHRNKQILIATTIVGFLQNIFTTATICIRVNCKRCEKKSEHTKGTKERVSVRQYKTTCKQDLNQPAESSVVSQLVSW